MHQLAIWAVAMLLPAAAVGQAHSSMGSIACRETRTAGNSELLRTHTASVRIVERNLQDATAWFALACVRSRLAAAGAVGREGFAMLSGTSWADGAIVALRQVLRLAPGHASGAQLLAELVMGQSDVTDTVLRRLVRDAGATSTAPVVLQACSELAARHGEWLSVTRCSGRALQEGVDSAFHLVQVARSLAAANDTAGAMTAFAAAAGATADLPADEAYQWHLHWFLQPDELAQFDSTAVAARPGWIRDRLALRDVRDLRPFGARLMTHFSRLEYVLANFRLNLSERIVRAGGLVGSTPDLPVGVQLNPDTVRITCEPGTVPAQPYRFYERWQHGIDDRGVVWMRFGAPSSRIPALPQCPPGRGSVRPSPNIREAWVYQLDGTRMILHFEGEQFDGSVEATRLVTGVLGSYMCDFDPYRCKLTQRSIMAKQANDPRLALPIEELERARRQDQESIEVATTRDDNAIPTDNPFHPSAQLHRLWNTSTGELLGVVVWAVKVRDVASASDTTVRLLLTLRQWDGVRGVWLQDSVRRAFRLPAGSDRDGYLTGQWVVPTGPGVRGWSVAVDHDGGRSGRTAQEIGPIAPRAQLTMSDVVLGASAQGQVWRPRSGQSVTLAPLGAFERTAPVALFWQLRSSERVPGARTSIAIFRTGVTASDPALRISFTQDIAAGTTEHQREVDISRLTAGAYRLEVTIALPDGTTVTRKAPLLVH